MGAISEWEIIEQVMDEPLGRSVGWLQGIAASSDSSLLFRLLNGMWQSGKISFADSNGRTMADWEVTAFLRGGTSCDNTHVIATDDGLDYAFGPGGDSG